MKQPVFCTAGDTAALRNARNILQKLGYTVSAEPSAVVTHLLLPVPSLEADGIVKGGQKLEDVLKTLPEDVTVLGGNLPALPCRRIDFLRDEFYLGENAAITAQCTIRLIQQHRDRIADTAVLIIGWGRIGKRLAPLLKESGADVTVAARKPDALTAASELGFSVTEAVKWNAQRYDIIINTAPAPVMDQQEARPDALLVDLASIKGITGDRVIWARGLPNKDAPDVSGILIAKTALRYALRKEQI